METLDGFSKFPGAAGSDVGKGQTFQSLAAEQSAQVGGVWNGAGPWNMTQVEPKVSVSDGRLQAILTDTFIGTRQREYESPHITIRMRNDDTARLLLSNCELMEASKVPKDIVKAVQADMKANPKKYIDNWNMNNPDHAISLPQEKENEQSTKDESWKDADWHKERERLSPGTAEV